jgi:hypothetical protein
MLENQGGGRQSNFEFRPRGRWPLYSSDFV